MRDHDDIAGRTFVITGGSSGIGRACARNLAGRGARLVLAARGAEALEKAAEECRERGAEAWAVPTDVSVEADVQSLRDRALEHFGAIDGWVSNAAVTGFGRVEDMPAEDFERILRTNVLGAVHSARAVVPHFREQAAGRLVIVSSVVGCVSQPFTGAYCASKAALLRLAGTLRQELRDVPAVRVCTLLPGSTDTPIFQVAANYTGWRARALEPVTTPESVAADLVGLLHRPRREHTSGAFNRAVRRAATWFPGPTERAVARVVEKSHFTGEPLSRNEGNLRHSIPGLGAVSGGRAARARPMPGALGWAALVGGVALALALGRRRAAHADRRSLS